MSLLRDRRFGRTMHIQFTTAIRRPSNRTRVRWMAALHSGVSATQRGLALL